MVFPSQEERIEKFRRDYVACDILKFAYYDFKK